jgi:hypothetical protein
MHAIIIGARFQEPLPPTHMPLWFAKFPHILYNRAEGEFPPYYNISEMAENCGREGYVYLSYLYENYHFLPNIIIFAQYDHLFREKDCPDVTSIMRGGNLSEENDGFAFVGQGCLDTRVRNFMYRYEAFAQSLAEVKEQMKMILGPDYVVKQPRYIPTGFFAVSREAVHRNPRKFYRRLAHMLGSKNSPWEGHFLERAWPEVFRSQCGQGELFCCRYAEPNCAHAEVDPPHEGNMAKYVKPNLSSYYLSPKKNEKGGVNRKRSHMSQNRRQHR